LKKRNILIASASRAERGLLEPIMIELEKTRSIEADWFLFDYKTDYIPEALNDFEVSLEGFKPEIVLIPCDRQEMVYIAAWAFHHGFIVAHFHAGDSGSGTTDEMNRYAISFFSHILFCNSKKSKKNLSKLGFESFRIHVVGSTALDHIEIDESLCPKHQAYDLILLHPDPVGREATRKDLVETYDQIVKERSNREKIFIWLEPNRDRNYRIILDFLRGIPSNLENRIRIYFENLPRAQFLGLLKNCDRAIGNSSAFTYELPLINPRAKLVKIGHRNIHRTPPKMKSSGSKRIAEILATIEINDRLKRKKLIGF
jgi:UDP-N-acetylglucosamine 2-epimerase